MNEFVVIVIFIVSFMTIFMCIVLSLRLKQRIMGTWGRRATFRSRLHSLPATIQISPTASSQHHFQNLPPAYDEIWQSKTDQSVDQYSTSPPTYSNITELNFVQLQAGQLEHYFPIEQVHQPSALPSEPPTYYEIPMNEN